MANFEEVLSFDFTLSDLMNYKKTPKFHLENSDLQNLIFTKSFITKEIFEINYSSNNEKKNILLTILSNFLILLNKDHNSKIFLIDTTTNFNIFGLFKSMKDFTDSKKIPNLLEKLFISQINSIQELISLLKVLKIHLNNPSYNIKLLIIDSINNLFISDEKMKKNEKKPKKSTFLNDISNYSKSLQQQVYSEIEEIYIKFGLSIIIFKRDSFKTYQNITYNGYQNNFQVTNKITDLLINPLFNNLNSYAIYLFNKDSFQEKALYYIINNTDIVNFIENSNKNKDFCYLVKRSGKSYEKENRKIKLFVYYLKKNKLGIVKIFDLNEFSEKENE